MFTPDHKNDSDKNSGKISFFCSLGAALVLTLLLVLWVSGAFEKKNKAGDFYYTFRDDNTVTVFVEKYDMAELVIPDSICGYRVSAIGAPKKADKINTTLVKIVIPETVRVIEGSAFENCVGFTELTFPAGLLKISENAFQGCSSLQEVNLPAGLKEVGDNAFSNCTSLGSAYLPASIDKMGICAFDGCPSLEIFSARESEPGFLDLWGYHWSGTANVHYGMNEEGKL